MGSMIFCIRTLAQRIFSQNFSRSKNTAVSDVFYAMLNSIFTQFLKISQSFLTTISFCLEVKNETSTIRAIGELFRVASSRIPDDQF
jgi:hypothetical protein